VAATNLRFASILADTDDQIYEVEYRMKHKGGDWVWLFDRARVFRRDATGKPWQILGVATEITTRKKTEAALQESESRLRTLADTLPQLVWVSNPEGMVQWQNLRNKEFFGDYYPGLQWMQFLHPDDVQRTTDVWQAALRTGDDYEIEYRFFDQRTGGYRWFLVNAIPLRNSDGEITNWFGTCTDIHDQKLMTKKLEALVADRTRELQRSNEDLQQFAHVASHDLKEPVRKIRTFINRFEHELGQHIPESGKVYISKVEKAAARMSAMIDGVLQYSSLDSHQVLSEPVDLNRVLQDVQNDLELVIQQKNATVECSRLPAVPGSPVLLHQLFYNLINNSLKFSREDTPPLIRIYSIDDDMKNETSIVVEDNGIGFRQQDAEKIFGTFIRLHSKDKYEGTGLGLALCQKIAERHGGTIKADGQEGQGARFTVLLPASPSADAENIE
jgi:PAS domain S-box-containing protein